MSRPSQYAPDTRPRRRHWSDDAACKGIDTEEFYPVGVKGVPTSTETAWVKQFCARCQVQPECLEHAMSLPEHFGVWGGLDEEERRAKRRREQTALIEQRLLEMEMSDAGATA